MCQRAELLINPNLNFLQRALDEPGENLSGSLGIVHQYVKMSEEAANPYDPVSETFNKVSFVLLTPLLFSLKSLTHSELYPA